MLKKAQSEKKRKKTYFLYKKNLMLKKIVEEFFPYFPVKIKKIISNGPYSDGDLQTYKNGKLQKFTQKKTQEKLPEETIKDISVCINDQKKIGNDQKNLRFLRYENKTEIKIIPPKARRENKILTKPIPFGKRIIPITPTQYFVNTMYNRYLNLPIKDRIDFFKTHIGQMMLSTEMHSQQDLKDSGFSLGRIHYKIQEKEKEDFAQQMLLKKYVFRKTHKSTGKTNFFFAKINKKSGIYENLIQKKERPLSADKFILDRPNTAFQFHGKQKRREPGKNILLFRRALYWGFGERVRKENRFQQLKIKFYLRLKNPRGEKRNQLYKGNHFLLTNFRNKNRVLKRKAMRIKQVVSKIIGPFYGHLRIKQMKNIYKKSRGLKSNILTQNEILISHFEKRLDVVVFRLNLAPTILGARRLIQNGCVFVVPKQDTTLGESMHASLKKIAFPLKLRDPKLLYSTTLGPRNFACQRFPFLSLPQKNIAYLLQPGDLIQCVAGNSLHQFKTKLELGNKPLSMHLLTQKHSNHAGKYHHQKFESEAFNSGDEMTEHFNSAIFLYAPQFRDLNPRDRITESFFRGTIL